jgi:hypothetical protein
MSSILSPAAVLAQEEETFPAEGGIPPVDSARYKETLCAAILEGLVPLVEDMVRGLPGGDAEMLVAAANEYKWERMVSYYILRRLFMVFGL